MVKVINTTLVFTIMFFILSCEEKNNVIINPELSPPQIISAQRSSSYINLDTTQPPTLERLPNGNFKITDSVWVRVTDPYGREDIREVIYKIYKPNTNVSMQTGKLFLVESHQDSSFSVFSNSFSFNFNRSEIGTYRLEIFARDRSKNESNSISLPIIVTKNNCAPTLDLPTIRQSTKPFSDSTLITLTIATSDPDGLSDIQNVFVQPFNVIDTSTKIMYDDGDSQNGDHFPGDGIFSIQLWIVPTASIQNVMFKFSAIDHSGEKSDAVQITCVNHPPKIINLMVPDSIKRPTSGFRLIPFHLKVEDPDGLRDIDSVYFRNVSSPTPTNFNMFDNGNLVANGDTVAKDGIYSQIVRITSTNTLGTNEFHFKVIDKAGGADIRIHFITVYE